MDLDKYFSRKRKVKEGKIPEAKWKLKKCFGRQGVNLDKEIVEYQVT